MSAVLVPIRQVPSLETMHAPTGVSGWHSLPKSLHEVGDCRPDMISPQMHCWTSDGAAKSQSAFTSMSKRRRASRCAQASWSRRFPFGTWAMPRQRPPSGRNTFHSCSCAARFPSRLTHRG